MDKHEYKIRLEEINTLISEGEFTEAVKIADTIDWNRVKSVVTLCRISDLYKINRRFQESKDILLRAYERNPEGRTIIYSLCELSIKMGETIQAFEYSKKFAQLAPNDPRKYILKYKMYEAEDVSLEERIAVLEEFKKRDYRERWGYELAYLYHRMGLETKCVEECDELFCWFGEGKYVLKALELKLLHQPLTDGQQKRYLQMKQESGFSEIQDENTYSGREAETEDEEQEEVSSIEEVKSDPVNIQPMNLHVVQAGLEERLDEIVDMEDIPVNEVLHAEACPNSHTKSMYEPLYQPVPEDAAGYSSQSRSAEMPGYGIEYGMPFTEQPAYPEQGSDVPTEPEGMPVQPAYGTGYGMQSTDMQGYPIQGSMVSDWSAPMPQIPVTEEDQIEWKADHRIVSMQNEPIPFVPKQSPVLETYRSEQVFFHDTLENTPYQNTLSESSWQENPVLEHTTWEQVPEDQYLSDHYLSEHHFMEQVPVEPQNFPIYQMEAYRTENYNLESPGFKEDFNRIGYADAMQDSGMIENPGVMQASGMIENPGVMQEVSSKDQEIQQESAPGAVESDLMLQQTKEIRLPEGQSLLQLLESQKQVSGDQASQNQNMQNHMETASGPIQKKVSSISGFEEMLSQGSDGQISMVIPERGAIEKQITGQMNIADALAEWEKFRKETSEKRMQNITRHVEKHTGNMLAEFDAAVNSGLLAKLKETEKQVESHIPEKTGETPGETACEPEKMQVPEVTQKPESIREVKAAQEPEPIHEPMAAQEPEPIREPMAAQEPESIREPMAVQESEKTREQEELLNFEDVKIEDLEDLINDFKKCMENTASESSKLEGSTADRPQTDHQFGESASVIKEAIKEAVLETVQEEFEKKESGEIPAGEVLPKETLQRETSERETFEREYLAAETPEKETFENKDLEKEDSLAVSGQTSEQGSVESADRILAGRTFTEEEKELFGDLLEHKRMRMQILHAVENMHRASYTGNVVITGEDMETAVELAANLVRILQRTDKNFVGRTAKIAGSVLNKNDVEAVLDQLSDGAMIVQNIGNLTQEAADQLSEVLMQENRGLFLVIIDEKEEIDALFQDCPDLERSFESRIDLKVRELGDDDLVEYAREYAMKKEFSIDDMGVLALYDRIGNMQTIDHKVTVEEVEDMVDDAIYFASKKNLKHFFDILLGKRYDKEDMIILKEKDFTHY